jgi:hypothetical protein
LSHLFLEWEKYWDLLAISWSVSRYLSVSLAPHFQCRAFSGKKHYSISSLVINIRVKTRLVTFTIFSRPRLTFISSSSRFVSFSFPLIIQRKLFRFQRSESPEIHYHIQSTLPQKIRRLGTLHGYYLIWLLPVATSRLYSTEGVGGQLPGLC